MGSIPIFWLKPYAFHDVVGSFGFNYGDASFSFDFFFGIAYSSPFLGPSLKRTRQAIA